MKTAGDLAKAAIESQRESSQTEWPDGLKRAKERIARVFAYFKAWFPHIQVDDLMAEAWVQETRGMSDAELQTGLERTKQSGLQFPPSLPKFLELCRPETGSLRYLGANPISLTQMRITGQLPQPEKQVHDISELRRALRSGQSGD